VRKRVAIAGHSAEGLALIPLLEANPEIDVCALYTPDPGRAAAALARLAPRLAERMSALITDDARAVLGMPGLVAVVDAELEPGGRAILHEAPERGIQVTTPLIARLLFAFGPVDGAHKADLLAALGEILDSYHLTIDRRALQERALQVAVAATGADRGSIMLWEPEEQCLRVAVALGLEPEVIAKIRIRSGEGIAGRAWAEGRAQTVSGRADHELYRIARARRDVAAALSVPLEHEGTQLGVLNLSHSTDAEAFDAEDLEFATQLARIEARIIARAAAHQRLVNDSARLRAEGELRAILASEATPAERLARAARLAAAELGGGLCRIYLCDRERGRLCLRGSSAPDAGSLHLPLDAQGGLAAHVLDRRGPLVLAAASEDARAVHALVPLRGREDVLGLLSFEALLADRDADLLVDRLRALAQGLAAALGDALREQRREREAQRAALLAATAVQLSAASDAGQLARLAASCAADLLEAEHALVRLSDETGRLRVRAYSGRATADEEPDLFELECGLAEEALRAPGALRKTDLSDRPFPDPSARPDCAIVVALRTPTQTLGTLSWLGRRAGARLLRDAFDADDEEAALQLAGHVQLALASLAERERTLAQQRSDPLTGLPNAVALAERIEAEIARSRGRGYRLSLVRVRVPPLKALCEAASPEAGDELVTSLAHEVRAAARDFDVVARTEPDGFAVLAPEPDTEPAALISALTRRLRAALARAIGPAQAAGLPLEFGYAVFPDDARDADELRSLAQRARVIAN
jgi:diguanylate cyclase (GGDEF)-like protein